MGSHHSQQGRTGEKGDLQKGHWDLTRPLGGRWSDFSVLKILWKITKKFYSCDKKSIIMASNTTWAHILQCHYPSVNRDMLKLDFSFFKAVLEKVWKREKERILN
jgi:hypothetical protein